MFEGLFSIFACIQCLSARGITGEVTREAEEGVQEGYQRAQSQLTVYD